MRGGKNPIDKFTKMQALAARIVNDLWDNLPFCGGVRS
jgi:hypothetical protein